MDDLTIEKKLEWWDSFIPAVIFMLAQIIFSVIGVIIILAVSGVNKSGLDISSASSSLAPGLGIATFLSFLFSLAAIYLYIKLRKLSFRQLGFTKFNYKIFGFIVLFLFVVLFIGSIYDALLKSVGLNTDMQLKGILMMFGKTPLGLIFMYLTIAVAAPIVEELIFRGFLFGYLESIFDFKIAASISALIFSFFHFYFVLIPVLFLLGYLLAYLYHKSGSLWPSIGVLMIDKNDVLKIANLARLNIDESELDKFVVQLGRILEYAQNISEIDTSTVNPATHAYALSNIFREDKVNHEVSREDALRNAPDKANNGFKVPKIV